MSPGFNGLPRTRIDLYIFYFIDTLYNLYLLNINPHTHTNKLIFFKNIFEFSHLNYNNINSSDFFN